MPHGTLLNKDGIKWTFTGVITFDEIYKANQEFYDIDAHASLKYFIWDMSEITHLEPSALDLFEITAVQDINISKINPNIIGVLIANDVYAVHFLNSYLKLLKETNTPWNVQLFDDPIVAQKWLDSALNKQ
ncbi:MAG: hypothetical protein OCD01_04645 [Fibrobacterales bacterium]